VRYDVVRSQQHRKKEKREVPLTAKCFMQTNRTALRRRCKRKWQNKKSNRRSDKQPLEEPPTARIAGTVFVCICMYVSL
jgi:hypothetical protein